MADVVPAAIGRLTPELRGRLAIVQQAREEDLDRVRQAYAKLPVAAEVAPFFADLPARMAASHLVVSRSGASTVAELAAIGRPAILVPLPHALDQDQFANAGVLERRRRRRSGWCRTIYAAPARRRDRRACRRAATAGGNGGGGAFPRPARRRRSPGRPGAGGGSEPRKPVGSRQRFNSGGPDETAARHRPGAFRRHRRHRHERHRRGDGKSRLCGAGLRPVRKRQRQAAARKGRQDRNRSCRRESGRRQSHRRVLGDQARQSGTCRGTRRSGCRWCAAPKCWRS